MTLFPKNWSGTVVMPALKVRNERIGGNTIFHFPTQSIKTAARLVNSDHEGHEKLETELPVPFKEILLRRRRARKIESELPVLTMSDDLEPDQWPDNLELNWEDDRPIYELFRTPENIRASWKKQFVFSEGSDRDGTVGLRKPQLGALHAIAAHFAVGGTDDDATVVLPTGTGKTETMLSALAYMRPQKLMVIVPSDALRTQIGNKFKVFGILRELACLPTHAINPRVAIIKTGIASREQAEQIAANSNVIVALPNTLESSHKDAVEALCSSCSDLFIDEAHHSTAETWKKIKDHFRESRITQFTATPFRRDKKHIGGRIVFNYKLSQAQDDDFYRPIRLSTVEEFGTDYDRNVAIASEAVRILREDLKAGYDHRIMARVEGIDMIDKVLEIYRALAPDLNPVKVHSGTGRAEPNRQALKALRGEAEQNSFIVVCANMLGEGYDLPQLKVAAIHENHKSLAVFLQFIGRFTRRAIPVGDAAVVLNVADAKAEKALEELYAQGADWDKIISRLSEDKVEEEIRLQDVIEDLKRQGSLASQLSLWNLTPSLSTQIIKTKCENWSPLNYKDAFPTSALLWHAFGELSDTLIVIGYFETKVKWGRYEAVRDANYGLLVAHWDKEQGILFANASDFELMRVSKVVQAIAGDDAELLDGDRVFNVLDGVELPLAKSLGSTRLGNISFTSHFGPNVTEGLASIEKNLSELNNIACLGYENGDRVLWGAAKRSGKIWQRKSATIREWLDWTSKTYEKIEAAGDARPDITEGFLRPVPMTEFPDAPAIAALWGEHLQTSSSDSIAIIFGEEEIKLHFAEVGIAPSDRQSEILLSFSSDELESQYAFKLSATDPKGYVYQHISGPPLRFRTGRYSVRDFDDQMYKDPVIIRYSDGTHSYNNYLIPVDLDAGNFDAGLIESWDWEGIPLNRESMGQDNDQATIQYRTFQNIADEFEVMFNDDGPGEAGDLVAFRDVDESEVRLTLVHCKGAVGGRVSADIRNLYTLCGQAQKSITVKHEGLKKLAAALKRRHETWMQRGASRLLKGNFARLSYFVEKSRKAKVTFEIVLVQPGISKATVTEDMLKLLGTTELYLKRTTQAEFRVVGS